MKKIDYKSTFPLQLRLLKKVVRLQILILPIKVILKINIDDLIAKTEILCDFDTYN